MREKLGGGTKYVGTRFPLTAGGVRHTLGQTKTILLRRAWDGPRRQKDSGKIASAAAQTGKGTLSNQQDFEGGKTGAVLVKGAPNDRHEERKGEQGTVSGGEPIKR